MEFPQELFDNLYLPIKMPNGKFRMRTVPLKSGFIECPCGYFYEYETERDMKMKLRMHLKICTNPPESLDICNRLKVPRKPLIIEKQRIHLNNQNRILYK